MSQYPQGPLSAQDWANQFYATYNRQPNADDYQAAIAAGQVVNPNAPAQPAQPVAPQQPAQDAAAYAQGAQPGYAQPGYPQQPVAKKSNLGLWLGLGGGALAIILVVVLLFVFGVFGGTKSAAGKYEADMTDYFKSTSGSSLSLPAGASVKVTLDLKSDKTCSMSMAAGPVNMEVTKDCTWSQDGRKVTLTAKSSTSDSSSESSVDVELSEDGKSLNAKSKDSSLTMGSSVEFKRVS
ncbi:MAG: hypothetical protein Q4P78_02455 [Rothia sp. (in: high G+C Gram-positive bacteria)]|uniref:hypothetical protein n=1 Tax=Rothia sp. (in: high G+C Gram-positive bacteria) TaxID=1885016 RepID=UPI0026E076E7|nr:hypothetical protein [Rothia sp. (in: high G+C Gram-positive bacteria)]MDO5750049.1 hypothetical protein [Rothia sp. (in: high G+C Gram-positive bacteria)]